MFSTRIYLIIEAMRPPQWMKNSLIFVAIIFSKNLLVPEAIIKSVAAFIIFSLVSGCVYIINDISDIEKDRAHPIKKNRPIASGRLKVGPRAG
jgi:4-hydroxybenzoate polyprenyltransferase